MIENKRGQLVVVSGPSGVGKGTVLSYVLDRDDFVYSVSCTTRKPRDGEVHGKNYFFITKEDFEAMIQKDEFVEYASYNGNYYGTPKSFVEKNLSEGRNVILEIEVQGAVKIKNEMPEAVFVFVAPESRRVLSERLHGRGTETEDVIEGRLRIAENEVRACLMYDYIVVNRDGKAKECAEDIVAAVRAQMLKPHKAYETVSEFFN